VKSHHLAIVFVIPLAWTASAQDSNPAALEFYGYTTGTAPQRAFLCERGRVYVAAEGDLIKDRYRLVRIQVDSAVVEDVPNQQRWTLPLGPPASSNASAAAQVQKVPNIARTGNPDNATRAFNADKAFPSVSASVAPEASAASGSSDAGSSQAGQYRFRQSHPRKQH
jgi:hypothetical protein